MEFRTIVVDGIETMYQINQAGEIISWRKQAGKNGGSARRSIGRPIKHQTNPQGYLIVKLYDDEWEKGWKQFSVHKLVYEAFIGIVPEKNETGEYLDVHHKDGNRKNPSLDNLELVTHSENVKHSKVAEVKNKSVEQYDLNGNFIASYVSAVVASKITGVHKQNIGYVCRGKTKTAGGFKWKFA